MLAPPNPDPETDYSAIVQDAATWSALTVAQQTFLQQGIYGLLLDNPSWLSVSTLSGFKASHDAGFVGQSETLRQAWLQLMADISTAQATLEPTYAILDSLSNQLREWFDAIAADPSIEVGLQAQITAALQQGEALQAQILQVEDQFAPTLQATVAQLLAQNDALDDIPQCAWNEKRYNQIALNWLVGTEPDSTDADDLRTIAQTCLADGGRAVLAARGLCTVWLKEYYDEGNCLQERASDGMADTDGRLAADLRIVPNPANEVVRISLLGSAADGQQVQVFSTDGRMVFSGKLSSDGVLAIQVKGWQGGLYLAKITGNSMTLSRIFVVQHP